MINIFNDWFKLFEKYRKIIIMKRKFTKEEDSKLCQLVKQYGAKKWDEIARNVPGRTGRQCRDRYKNYLCPGYFNGEWTKEEDQLLCEIFNSMPNKWSKMVRFFPRRSAYSLKNRWNYFVSRNYNEIKNKINNNVRIDISTNRNDNQYYIPLYFFPVNTSPINTIFNEKDFINNEINAHNEIEMTHLTNAFTQTYELSNVGIQTIETIF